MESVASQTVGLRSQITHLRPTPRPYAEIPREDGWKEGKDYKLNYEERTSRASAAGVKTKPYVVR